MSKNKNNKKIEIKEEKIEIKTDKKAEKVILTATKNTFLADGTFVKQGDKVELSREYAERLKKERANNFK